MIRWIYPFTLACVTGAGLSLQAELLFREDWAESPAALPITEEDVANPDLVLSLFGGAREGLKKSHHEEIPNDPYYAWSGEITTGNWAVTLSALDGRTFDLTDGGQVTWRTRQSGENCLRILLRQLSGDWLISEPVACASTDWQETTHILSDLDWETGGANDGFTGSLQPVSEPDLSRIVEVGFTDLRAGASSAESSRVDWLEVHGEERLPVCPFSAVEGSDADCAEGPMSSIDGLLGTRWFAEGDGSSLTATIDRTSLLSSIEIAWWKGDERATTFEVLTSLDGETWEVAVPVTESSGTVRDYECYDLTDPVEARYVKLIGHENTVNKWNSIVEWRVRGTATGQKWYEAYSPVNGWCQIPSLGWMSVELDPWLWHGQLTWLYTEYSGDGMFSFWDYDLGWFWTSEVRFPLLYAYETDTWYWFGGGPDPRWFYNMKSGLWEQH